MEMCSTIRMRMHQMHHVLAEQSADYSEGTSLLCQAVGPADDGVKSVWSYNMPHFLCL